MGVVRSELDGSPAPPRSTGHALSWATDTLAVTVVGARPVYEGVDFGVDGHFAWLWRVRVLRDIAVLRIVTHLTPDRSIAVSDAGPVHADWLLGVRWATPTTTVAVGTGNLEALMVRSGGGDLIPDRYLEDADPTTPGAVPFITRSVHGIVAEFDAPRAGEAFEHHVALAWAPTVDEDAVIDAIEVEAQGILRGAGR